MNEKLSINSDIFKLGTFCISFSKYEHCIVVIFYLVKTFSQSPKAHELFLYGLIQTYSLQMIFDIEVVQK